MPPYIAVTQQQLVNAGFSVPSQANSFYPPGNQDTHVHLGVPTQHDGKVAPEDTYWVIYVSIKYAGQTYAQLSKSGVTGLFNPDIGKAWPPGLCAPVAALGILRSPCPQ